MIKVSIYRTIVEAEESLESVVGENNSVLEGLKNTLKDLSSHKSRTKYRTLTAETELDCLFFLNKEGGKYDFSYGVKSLDEGISELTCNTIDELVSEIKNCLTTGEIFGKYSSYGIKINPVFYTIIEPEVLTEAERRRISDELGWEIDHVDADGLSADEIEKFVSVY